MDQRGGASYSQQHVGREERHLLHIAHGKKDPVQARADEVDGRCLRPSRVRLRNRKNQPISCPAEAGQQVLNLFEVSHFSSLISGL